MFGPTPVPRKTPPSTKLKILSCLFGFVTFAVGRGGSVGVNSKTAGDIRFSIWWENLRLERLLGALVTYSRT